MKNSGAFLIGITDCTQDVCAASGRISTQDGTALEIFERSHDENKNTNLISKVTKSGHTSTIEHCFFNIAFENVSVVVEQFMIEFRLASFTVKSRRYVNFSSAGYYVPEIKNEADREKFISVADKLFSAYDVLTQNGVLKEDARFVLPYCFYSNFYCSLNGRELCNVLSAMIYGRGKKIYEIYKLGLSLLSQCREKAPGIFSDFEEKMQKYSDDYDFDFEFEKEKKSTSPCDILAYTENGEKLIAKTALIEKYNCSNEKAEALLQDDRNIEKILSGVLSSKRPRALEAFTCTVRFNGVSLSCLTHFARHRIQGLCVPNLMKTSRENYIIPETVKKDEKLLKVYCEAFDSMKNLYDDFKDKYDENVLIYCVLSGNALDIATTMNARELQLFCKLRCCTRAQWEIQEFADDFLKKLRQISPLLFKYYGPSCYTTGVCPEGRLSCGRAKEIKEIFTSLG